MKYLSILNHFDKIYNFNQFILSSVNLTKCQYYEKIAISEDGKIPINIDDKVILFSNNRAFFNSEEILFNLIDENDFLCSYLVIEDKIRKNIAKFLLDILDIQFRKSFNMKRSNTIYNIDSCEDIPLVDTDIDSYYKFKNIFTILNSVDSSINIFNFSFYSEENTSAIKVTVEHPLYELMTMNNINIFGIDLNNNESTFFKKIYKKLILNKLKILENDFEVQKKNSKTYTLLHFYLQVKKDLILEKHFNYEKKLKTLNDNFNKINICMNKEENQILIEKYEQMKEIDNLSYDKELKIRKNSSPNWLFLKDNIVQQNQPTVQNNVVRDIEVLEDFSNNEKYVQNLNNLIEFISDEKAMLKYKKSFNELISLGQKASNINRVSIQNEFNQKLEKENKLHIIYYWQDVALSIINRNGICLWQDATTEDYYFRAGINNKIKSRNKDKTSKKISAALNTELKNLIQNNTNLVSFAVEIKIVESVEEAYRIAEKSNLNNLLIICIFKQEIPVVEDEVFNIQNSYEFFKYHGSLNWTRNLFVHNNHLIKRHIPNNMNLKESYSYSSFRLNKKTYLLEKSDLSDFVSSRNLLKFKQPKFVNNNKESFIEQFIFYLVNENIDIFNYVMNWIAYFFQTLNKTSTALVLLGDKDSSEEYFLKNIIKEIFGSKYCTTICDEEYKKPIVSDIADGKIFYHIANIDNKKTKFDNKTLSQILKQLLLRQSVESKNKDNKHDLMPIYGQTIITSDEAYEITKPCFSKCTVVKVNDLETIIDKLEIPDEGILESKIQEDLELFSAILSKYPVNKDFAKYALTTEDRDLNKKEELKIIDENVSISHVDEFINAFKSNKEDFLKYFEIMKEDKKFYNQLVSAYEEGYYISQDLYTYFTKIYENHVYSNKAQFIKELKEKDDMFKQEIDTLKALDDNAVEVELFKAYKTSKEFDYKKLAKIKEFKLAENIKIPRGFIILNREGNARFKYEYEDLETAKKMYAKYDKEQLEKKQEAK